MIKPSFYMPWHLLAANFFSKMYHWSVDSCNARNWYTNKWTLVIQLIKRLSNWLEQPFTQAAFTFDYVYRFQIFVTCVCARSHCYWISHLPHHIVTAKLIETRNKQKASDPSDPSNCKNPVIALNPMDPSDWKVRNK